MYEVQTYTECQGWVNTWQVDDKPERFHCKKLAEAELVKFLADPDQDPRPEDYRIIKVGGTLSLWSK